MTKLTGFFLCLLSLSGLSSCGGSNGEPVTADYLAFYAIEKDEREVHLGVTLEQCRSEDVACYSVTDLDLTTDPEGGANNKGNLTDDQAASINALLTDDLQAKYEKDKDPECDVEPELSYWLNYYDHEGLEHFWCFDAGDDLSAETQNMIDVLTELSEQLLKEKDE
jgi:hypothetical protein